MEAKHTRSINSPLSISTSIPPRDDQKSSPDDSTEKKQRKPLGWKIMPFILGNETFERLGSFGITANFTVYMLTMYNMSVYSIAMLGIWNGLSNFLTVICAFVADAYTGKFLTILCGSFATILGMLMVTLTAVVPNLRPPQCTLEQRNHGQCIGPNKAQLAFLHIALCFLALGGAGIRPCSIPFAVDQFDSTTDKGRKDINSFFNWYYTSFSMVLLITSTLVVYVQTVNWAWGFAIPTVCMVLGLILLFAGSRFYIYVKPEGSVIYSIAQVLLAAYKKRRLQLPCDGVADGVYYDPPLEKTSIVTKLPLSSQCRFLNKGAIIEDINEIKADGGCINPWRLCSIQQVEEVKCLMNIFPVWTSAIISCVSLTGTGTFLVAQALKMDRHLGHNFEVPAPSVGVITMIVNVIFLPIYDRLIVPALENITKQEGGITLLQRIGVGNIWSILAMATAGFVERKRRASTDGVESPIFFMWLAPQLTLMGLFEIFLILGYIEFYNKQFPEHMRSIGNSLVFLTVSVSIYVSSLVITLVHRYTGKDGRPNWLTDDINAGKLDYFYFLIAGLGLLNFMYFLFVASRFRYKATGKKVVAAETYSNVEQDSSI
ncbi:hypothetical protein ACOSQ2_018463 [Xanthoceras sorbifolium]|uniref:Uncharacterized protein n=1 Tax=Xanthoceras sorbifolium TaxID=99658 RepID=A0ABQ8I0L0_9ROSI|nr:hypothetical protein JRO89_XS05G0061400 [Xanthoceras sorbifolium]